MGPSAKLWALEEQMTWGVVGEYFPVPHVSSPVPLTTDRNVVPAPAWGPVTITHLLLVLPSHPTCPACLLGHCLVVAPKFPCLWFGQGLKAYV